MSELKPVAYRQHIGVTKNGIKIDEYGYSDIQIMQGDDALFTAEQLKAEREKVIRECADACTPYLYHEYTEMAEDIQSDILALLSTDESKE